MNRFFRISNKLKIIFLIIIFILSIFLIFSISFETFLSSSSSSYFSNHNHNLHNPYNKFNQPNLKHRDNPFQYHENKSYCYFDRIYVFNQTSYYLATNDLTILKPLSDELTAKQFNLTIFPYNESQALLDLAHQRYPIPIVNHGYQGRTPDDRMLYEITTIEQLSPQPQLIHSVKYIGKYINPSILPSNLFLNQSMDQYLLIGWLVHQKNEPNRSIGFQWLNLSMKTTSLSHEYPYVLDLSSLPSSIPSPFTSLNSSLNSSSLSYFGLNNNSHYEVTLLPNGPPGQDPRVIAINLYSFAYFFTNYFAYYTHQHLRVGMAIVEADLSTKQLIIRKRIHALNPDHDVKQDHKNWIPFLHSTKWYFIETINPLRISTIHSKIKTIKLKKKKWIDSNERWKKTKEYWLKTILLQPYNKGMEWSYGALRGGTNAIRIDSHRYLSFFHSSKVTDHIITYYFGAFTFSTLYPFHIMAWTPQPIVHRPFYDGFWTLNRGVKLLDYCLFPTNVFQETNMSELVVTLGRNDRETWLITFVVDELLLNMQPIN